MLEGWWASESSISKLQGACKKVDSCVHTTFIFRETIGTLLEGNRKCLVAFFDVAKAFDTIWIQSLFYQLYQIWIQVNHDGCYINFCCQARVHGHLSQSYALEYGILQGFFCCKLNIVFIISLLVSLNKSGSCCKIYPTPGTPL